MAQLKNNTRVYKKETQKNGKKFTNFYCETTLANGEKVTYQIKLAFYNKKFAYKLACGIDDEKASK